MPVVTFRYDDFISLLGKTISQDILVEKLPMIGVSIERVEGNEISIEVFPNRPDLLSVEGMARAARAFLGLETGLQQYSVVPPQITLSIDDSVLPVRPYIAGAVIRNIELTDNTIASLMEMQEKLHFSIGKDRKKMAIGVHDFDRVTPPFVYKAVKPEKIRFIPLGKEEDMDLKEILLHHEKGILYAHLLQDLDVCLYPFFQNRPLKMIYLLECLLCQSPYHSVIP